MMSDASIREQCLLKKELKNYHFVAQAELTIDSVDDGEEMKITSVCFLSKLRTSPYHFALLYVITFASCTLLAVFLL